MLNDGEIEDTKMGLEMMGSNSDLVEWLTNDNPQAIPQLNEVSRSVRLYGAGQSVTQAQVSEPYCPVRVTGKAEKMVYTRTRDGLNDW